MIQITAQSGGLLQFLLIAAVQGVTELFPVSSLAHAILLQYFLHLNLTLNSDGLLPFLTCLHLGTAFALIIYFWKDWWALIQGIFDSSKKHERKLLFLLIVATIPAGLIGLFFEKSLGILFTDVHYVAMFLVINGILLLLGEKLRKKSQHSTDLSGLSYPRAFLIGIAQAFALLPGISRSGISLIGGLLVGLSHEAAARLSFLLATPIILAAGLLELPKLFKPEYHAILMPSLLGGVVAGIFAYASTYFLLRYFKKNDNNSLAPFGIYCLVAGLLTFASFVWVL
jgi:undecaprenyl-diphosphatase